LAQLAKRNKNGVFPRMRGQELIDGEFGKPSLGTAENADYGSVFPCDGTRME
jgi:hypothetical protein